MLEDLHRDSACLSHAMAAPNREARTAFPSTARSGILRHLAITNDAAARRASRLAVALACLFGQPQTGHAAPRHAAAQRGALRPVAAPRAADAASLAQRILAFAESHEGVQVGDGECASLADTALSLAGARAANAYGARGDDGDYVWGRPVRLADAQPGDILQFRNFHILRRVTRMLPYSGMVQQGAEMEERDHHTAIVERNLGGSLVILEQNVDPGGRVVQRGRIEIANGITHDSGSDGASVTAEVSVEGEVRAYRPEIAGPGA